MLKQLQFSTISQQYYMQSIADTYIAETQPGSQKTGISWWHHTIDDPADPARNFKLHDYWELNDHRPTDPPSRPRHNRGRGPGGGTGHQVMLPGGVW